MYNLSLLTLNNNVDHYALVEYFLLFIPYLTDCSTPVNFSLFINTTENDISNIHIRWNNQLNMNFTYYVNISTNFENDIKTISTDNLYIDFTSRVGVSYNIYISTYCCNNLTEIVDFQFTILRNNSIKVIGDILYNINSINQDNISEVGSFITTISTGMNVN